MPLESFKCSICGAQAPKKYREHGQFSKRMAWLRRHRKRMHPAAHKRSVRKPPASGTGASAGLSIPPMPSSCSRDCFLDIRLFSVEFSCLNVFNFGFCGPKVVLTCTE